MYFPGVVGVNDFVHPMHVPCDAAALAPVASIRGRRPRFNAASCTATVTVN